MVAIFQKVYLDTPSTYTVVGGCTHLWLVPTTCNLKFFSTDLLVAPLQCSGFNHQQTRNGKIVPVYNAIQPLPYVIQPGKALSSMSMSRTYIKIKFRGKDDHTISNTDSTRGKIVLHNFLVSIILPKVIRGTTQWVSDVMTYEYTQFKK